MSQEKKILEYIKEHGSITTLDAFTDLGCARLSARIANLRSKGIDIVSEQVSVRNRFGQTCHVARYSLNG